MSQKKQVSRLHRRQRPRPYAVCDARRLLPEYIGRQHICPNARHRAGITARACLLMSFGPASPAARERSVKRGARLDAQDFPVACVVTWEQSFFVLDTYQTVYRSCSQLLVDGRSDGEVDVHGNLSGLHRR